MLKKRMLPVLLVIVLCLSLVPTALSADTPQAVISPQRVQVNGADKSFEVYNIDGSNYFKLRDIAYVLNGTDSQFSVSYDAEQNCVAITTGMGYSSVGGEMTVGADKSGSAVLSRQSVLIDGAEAELSAYNIGGNNFFQLRALADALSFSAGYDSDTNSVVIESGEKTSLDAEKIYYRCSSAVFYIEVFDSDGGVLGSGSGFFIDADGTAVTNFHVIDGAASAAITISDTGETYPVAGVYDYSKSDDWAVLKVGGSGFSYLTAGDDDAITGGATVYAIGSPLGLQNTITEGIISNPSRDEGGVNYIQISAAISAGSSGGALLNKYGEVIGITSASYVNGQNLNLALPISYIKEASTESTVALSTVNPPDPIQELIEFVLDRGKPMKIGYTTAYEYQLKRQYTVGYVPENDILYFETLQSDSSTEMGMSIYFDDATSIKDTLEAQRYFIFKFSTGNEWAVAKGYVYAPSFTVDSDLEFETLDQQTSPYRGSFDQDELQTLAKLLLLDLLGNMQVMCEFRGLSITIADLGFEAEYQADFS